MSRGKVLLGLSGGVDSAVAAYLLKRDGYEVTGCFMRNWDAIANNDIRGNPTLGNPKCPQEEDYDDAARAASELGIPLLRIDFVQEYWDHVFSYFLAEYRRGRTPNPDIFCNRYIKFDAFRSYAKEHGFGLIAMGHYARREDRNGFTYLYKAADRSKDQSYFLAEVQEEQLRDCLFPLGDMTKTEVRAQARALGLYLADKKDSTGVCFIGERNFKEFLANYLPATPGPIVDLPSGLEVGRHDGVLYYTVGQHRGLNIGGRRGFKDEPFVVVGKNVASNVLYVAQEPNEFMYSSSATLSRVNWLGPSRPTAEVDINCKFRYRGRDLPVKLRLKDNGEALLTYERYPYIAKGQLAAFYDGDCCLGGGIIEEIYDGEGKRIEY